MLRHRLMPVLGVTAALTLAACGDDNNTGSADSGSGSSESSLSGKLAGAGSSAQEAAQGAWIAGFQSANSGATISYDPVGSGGGREQFVAGGVDFAGSDAALKEDELAGAEKRCGGAENLIELPAYVSPIAVIYNLEGVDGLQLDPATIAGIFLGKIKKWNDPAIAATNEGVTLPDTDIVPVHRSDDSGTTENFTDYLHVAAKDVWTAEPDGEWPTKSGEAADGTSGVVAAVKNGAGTIGYADASQAGELGKAKVKVGDAYVEPTADAAAKILEESKRTEGAASHVWTYTLNRTPDAADTYPVVLTSYLIGCTKYDDAAKAELVKGYFNHVVSADGQSKAAETAGSAPLTDTLRGQIQPSVDAIGSAS
ncbi:MAG: phosphate ABC transporter substrate-binding protein PstS [Solirubrobacteraceae bacterium]|nr:phosphate ABC transporter substrate-binding protein PstS [Solirubrobacteraceae bacterium]